MDAKILNSLATACSKAELCSRDVLQKALKKTDGDRAAAGEIVARLQSEGFIDDSRYAAAFAREKSSLTGWGPVKIRFALKEKGIDQSVIDSALSEIDPERAGARLSNLLEAKRKSLEGDPQIKFKLIRFALSRGYEYPEVEAQTERILHGRD